MTYVLAPDRGPEVYRDIARFFLHLQPMNGPFRRV